jgi:hypothetical protein
MPGVACPNLTGQGGCGIYESRPQTCRKYFCGWRLAAGLGGEWRPDRSGVMIMLDQVAGAGGPEIEWQFTIVGPPETVQWLPLAEAVMNMVRAGRPTALSLAKINHFSLKTGLNEWVQAAAATGDIMAVRQRLIEVYEALAKNPYVPAVMDESTATG